MDIFKEFFLIYYFFDSDILNVNKLTGLIEKKTKQKIRLKSLNKKICVFYWQKKK